MGRLGFKGSGCFCTSSSSKHELDTTHCTESLDHCYIPQIYLAIASLGLGLITSLAPYWYLYSLDGNPSIYAFHRIWPSLENKWWQSSVHRYGSMDWGRKQILAPAWPDTTPTSNGHQSDCIDRWLRSQLCFWIRIDFCSQCCYPCIVASNLGRILECSDWGTCSYKRRSKWDCLDSSWAWWIHLENWLPLSPLGSQTKDSSGMVAPSIEAENTSTGLIIHVECP